MVDNLDNPDSDSVFLIVWSFTKINVMVTENKVILVTLGASVQWELDIEGM